MSSSFPPRKRAAGLGAAGERVVAVAAFEDGVDAVERPLDSSIVIVSVAAQALDADEAEVAGVERAEVFAVDGDRDLAEGVEADDAVGGLRRP